MWSNKVGNEDKIGRPTEIYYDPIRYGDRYRRDIWVGNKPQ